MRCADPQKAEAVFAKVLQRIKPSAAETRENFAEAERLIAKLEKAVPQGVEVVLAGSLAKGTNLAGHNEFDIFLLFPQSMKHSEMVSEGMRCAKKAFLGMKTLVRYAEHPYLQVFSGRYRADIVPAYKIYGISEKGSSVDRSQLHTPYINSKLDERGKDNVRLLKKFMQNFGIYGAELRVEGFSGYLCELLIAHHSGSLLSLMEAAADWKEPAIDHDGNRAGLEHRERFNAPLIVIDPVDTHRNVAAVVAQTSLSRFIFECRRFLKEPSEKFFFSEKKIRSLKEIRAAIRARKTACLSVLFRAPEVVPDVLWPQLRKTAHALARWLSDREFSVFGMYHWSDGQECAILFELDRWQLPAISKAVGPSLNFADDVDAFVEAHRGCLNLHLEHDRIVAVEKRGATDAKEALAAACGNPSGLGIPEHMQRAMRKCRVGGVEILMKEKFREMLSDYFFARIA